MEFANLLELSNQLARAVETGEQAVVAVHGRPHVPSSGVLWRPGVVVTTDHTLKRDEDLTVTLADGRNLPATLAGRDGGTDLAVLRLANDSGDSGKADHGRADSGKTGSAAKPVPDASIKAGHLVLALGRRGRDGISVSFGAVSAISGAWRTWRGGQIDRFIRPDVNIYVGFSGGALVDVEGQVIGINTTGLTRGVGVTIPASTVARVTDELLARGRVRRGFLGVGLHPVELPDGGRGLIVLSLEPGGPALRAGVFVGDVLLALDGQKVTDTDDVQSHLGAEQIGKTVVAEILRGGSRAEIGIVPAEK